MASLSNALDTIVMEHSGMQYALSTVCMAESKQWVEHATVYQQRNPQKTHLWNLINNHYDNFEQNYHERFEREYGFFRPIISEVAHNYLGRTEGRILNIKCCGVTSQ